MGPARFLILALALGASVVSASPLACQEDCEVGATLLAYVPPVFEVASGAGVAWRATDAAHVQADWGAGGMCFASVASAGSSSVPVVFTIRDGSLVAKSEDGEAECHNAEPAPGGGYSLAYRCLLHAGMTGVLVVTDHSTP